MSLVLPDVADVTEAAESGFGLYVWSDTGGCWECLFYSADRFKVARLAEHIALAQCLLFEPLIIDLPSLDRRSRVVMGSNLSPPLGAVFVDPAPDGVFPEPSIFDALIFAASAQAQFSTWRSEAFWQSEGEAITVDDALRLLFIDRAGALDGWLAADQPYFRG